MESDKPSSEWTPESVGRRLKESAGPGQMASAQVFFNESVPADQLSEVASKAIEEATAKIGGQGGVTMGRIHKLAKSVSVSGDPDIIAELQSLAPVKSVLPSQIDDIYPKPVRVKPLP
ncbi:hypothetical protein SAMN05519104_0068 [Rhizobiales bacterium GAS188]|nr:hypothetical protein SAMN05519104_0068 [Rhizobiales bacterium GAS188]